MKAVFSRQILESTQIPNFINIRCSMRAGGQADMHDEGNSCFGNFANAPKSYY